MVHAGQLFNNSTFTFWKDILFHSGMTIGGKEKKKKVKNRKSASKSAKSIQILSHVQTYGTKYRLACLVLTLSISHPKNTETICGKEILSRPSCQYTENFQGINSFMTPRYNKRKHMTSEQTSCQRCKKTYQQNTRDP